MTLQEYLDKHNNIKSLIFDFDLTIAKMDIDWSDWHPAVAKIFQKYDPDFKYSPGDVIARFTNEFISKYGKELRDEVWAHNREYELTRCKGFIPNDELLSFVKNNTKHMLYVYSSNSSDILDKAFEELKIKDKFIQIIAREDVKLIKPDTCGFEKIRDFSKNKEKFLFIGDSDSDKIAAESVGIDYFQVDLFGTYNL